MATPTPFSALSSSQAWQIPNPMASTGGLPGAMTPFWGAPAPSQSQSAMQAQNLRNQLAVSPASPALLANTRMTLDVAGQFCLGLALLVTILTH